MHLNRIALAGACVLLGFGLRSSEARAGEGMPAEVFQTYVQRLNRLAASPENSEAVLSSLLDEAVDMERLTQKTFRDYCGRTLATYERNLGEEALERLRTPCQDELAMVYRRRLAADLAALIRTGALRTLHLGSSRISGEKGRVELRAVAAADSIELTAYIRSRAGEWKIENLRIDGKGVDRIYRKRCKHILDKAYSLPVLTAFLQHQDYIVLEDFSTTAPDSLPADWSWRPKDNKKIKPYKVQTIHGHHYLAARDSGNSVILLKFSRWNPREYPIMTWCWRANALPPGGDERYTRTNDSAAGIYVIFSQNWLGIPRQLKYVWSTTLPEGTVDRRKKIARPWFSVIESGAGNLGKWVFEQIDLLADYQRILGGRPKSRTVGIGLLTDANSTDSYAEAYYADFRVWKKKALDEGLIENYCACLEETTANHAGGTHSMRVFPSIEIHAAEELKK